MNESINYYSGILIVGSGFRVLEEPISYTVQLKHLFTLVVKLIVRDMSRSRLSGAIINLHIFYCAVWAG